jgi:ABC-type glycerol-3-phosphate transport system substrate-binding protein
VLGAFTPSTLEIDAQLAEMAFFVRAAAPFRVQRIHVVSASIPTHEYDERVLARAFHDITGVRVHHDLVHEGELVERIQQQTRTGRNLSWFRYDWFQREDLQCGFEQRYRYPLGVPLNWRACEDIADFFTNQVREIVGRRVYGHMDYGKLDPSLGWRFTDAWLAMAGVGDLGLPNGTPTAAPSGVWHHRPTASTGSRV